MREDYKAWLEAQGYAANTCVAQVARVQRLETAYGPLDAVIASGGYESLFRELSYATDDERHNRPNPSRLHIKGKLREGLASAKDAFARYARFLREPGPPEPVTAAHLVDRPVPPLTTAGANPDLLVLEKQRLSLERDMQSALRQDIGALEPGLQIIDDGAERAVLSGFIDILARDAAGSVVVVELKAGRTDPRVIAQILGYMGDIADQEDGEVRGIIVAHEFDQRTRSAARAVRNLALVRYAVSFRFEAEALS